MYICKPMHSACSPESALAESQADILVSPHQAARPLESLAAGRVGRVIGAVLAPRAACQAQAAGGAVVLPGLAAGGHRRLVAGAAPAVRAGNGLQAAQVRVGQQHTAVSRVSVWTTRGEKLPK